MFGKIIEGLDEVTQGKIYGTYVRWIECSADWDVDDKPDGLMLICWCGSLDIHLFWTNLDTEIDFWYGKILGRIHKSVNIS